MKKKIINKLIALILIGIITITTTSCGDDDNLTESQLDTSTPELSELDVFIREEFVDPFNMEVVYKWNENEFELNRYLYPPDTDGMETALKVVKKVWIDSYTEVGGDDFVKRVAPRKLVFAGGMALNTDGTRTLGLAEGGKKITFFETDYLDTDSEDNVKLFISTVQHEYCHILNQTKPYDKQAWGQVNPGGDYTSAWYNESDAGSQALGFVSAYARSNVDEDIAETLKTMLQLGQDDWNSFVNNLNQDAQEKIREKESILANYLQTQYDTDLYELQDAVEDNIQYVIDNY